MKEDIVETISIWDNHIIPIKEKVKKMITLLDGLSDPAEKASTLFEISKEYKTLAFLSKSKENMALHMIKFYNSIEKNTTLSLMSERQDYEWKNILYQEKARRLMKDLNVIPPNYTFFMDIHIQYKWFIEDKMKIREERDLFDYQTLTTNHELNILLNNIKYSQSGISEILNQAKKKKNLEILFLYHEVMGDLFLLSFFLMKKVISEEAGATYLYFAIEHYRYSEKYKVLTDNKNVAVEGIVGYPYQDVLGIFFQNEAPYISPFNVSSKLSYIKRTYSIDISSFTFKDFGDEIGHRGKLFEKIKIHLIDIENDQRDSFDMTWKILLNHLGLLLLQSYNRTDAFRHFAEKWENEKEMHNWFDMRYIELQAKEDVIQYAKEAEVGGGKCEHIINGIPIEDKIASKSQNLYINEFIDEQYNKHYTQISQYANGSDSRYSILVIADKRPEVLDCKIKPDSPHNCLSFKYNKKDNLWCAIFVFQVYTKAPSQMVKKKEGYI